MSVGEHALEMSDLPEGNSQRERERERVCVCVLMHREKIV